MEALAIIAIALPLMAIAGFIISIRNSIRLKRLEAVIQGLQAAQEDFPSFDVKPSPWESDKTTITASSIAPKRAHQTPVDEIFSQNPFPHTDTDLDQDREETTAARPKFNFEQNFGARLPVWIGGISLVLAGFFLVRYTIEAGLLGPEARIVIGTLFGITLLAGGYLVLRKSTFAGAHRAAQALTGAGIADLYICFYAATNLYNLVSPLTGFLLLGAVTAMAIMLSLLYGMPIALMGLIGGFLTPALIQSPDPSAPLLFLYLYIVFAALLFAIRASGQWFLAMLSLLAVFLWVIVWVSYDFYMPDDLLWIGIFLVAVCLTISALCHVTEYDDESAQDSTQMKQALHYLSFIGAAVLIFIVVAENKFSGLLQWPFYWLLSAGGLVLGFNKSRRYEALPFILLVLNMALIVFWQAGNPALEAQIIGLFAVTFMAAGLYGQIRLQSWRMAALVACAAIGYYLTACYKISPETFVFFTYYRGALALLLSILSAVMAAWIYGLNVLHRQHLLAVYVLATSAFLSLAFIIELHPDFLPVFFALQIAAVAVINRFVTIDILRPLAIFLIGAFIFLLFPQILLLIQLTAYSLSETKLYLQNTVPLVDSPLFQLGLPALSFLAASFLFRAREKETVGILQDDLLVRILEVVAIALTGLMGYYLTRNLLHPGSNILFMPAEFTERGIITNVIFVFGLFWLYAGRRFNRKAITASAIALCGIALFRIFYFDFLIHNPLREAEHVGSSPLFNALFLPYGLPVLWIFALRHAFANRQDSTAFRTLIYGAIPLLCFTFVSLNVRQFFHGAVLVEGTVSNAEIYSYSVAWLLIGIGLLFIGTALKDKTLRIESLLVILFTVGKVFLYDASELDGFYRVFSFLGLGLCLIGLGYFYSRYVFRDMTLTSRTE